MKKRMIKLAALCLVLATVFTVSANAVNPIPDKPFDNSQFFLDGDYSIHYRVFEPAGQPKGRIMMLHGFLMSTYSWEAMAAQMTGAGYTCILADLPNFGYSTRENKDTAVIPREDLVVSLMESIAPLNTWCLAGHSMGGGVAMNIVLAHPEIKALLLYCPAPNTAVPAAVKPLVASKLLAAAYSAFFKFASYPKLLVRLAIGYIAVDFPFGMRYDTAKITDPLQIDGSGTGMTYVTINTRATDTGALAGLKMPILLVQGEKDNVLQNIVSEVNAALPQATLYTVKGGSHMCIENKAPEVAGVTLDFLNNLSV